MGLAWQQGPLGLGAIGRFLVPGPLPERMLFAEPAGHVTEPQFAASLELAASSGLRLERRTTVRSSLAAVLVRN